MDKSTIKTLGNAVGFTVAMDRKGVMDLLKIYNIPVSENPSNGELISLVINKGLVNDSFRKDFQALTLVMKSVAKKLGTRPKASSSSSFIPQNDLINGGWASADGGTDWGGLAGSLVSSATSIFTTIKATDAQRKLAEAQAKISADQTASAIAQGQTQLEIEKLKLQQLQLVGSQPNTSNSSKTLLYVGIGFGALLLIGGLILVLKKK